MTQPNYFKRNSANLEFGTYDGTTAAINGGFPTGDWAIKNVQRFDDGGDTNAIIPFYLGGIHQFSVKAFNIWLDVEGTPLQSTNVDEILDFFLLP